MAHNSSVGPLRIVLAQINLLVGDVDANVERMLTAARRARDEFDADLIAFPELALVSYPPEDLLLRPGMQQRVESGLQRLQAALSSELSGMTAIVGHPLHRGQGLFNAVSVLRDGATLGVYCKQILPNYSVFDEQRYFVPGASACVVTIKGVAIGITLCEDIWRPGPARQSVEAGAQLVLNLNASPFHRDKSEEREAVVAERVGELGVPVLYLNLVGGQDELVFDGASFAMAADGRVSHRAAVWEETLMAVDVALDHGVWQLRPGPGPVEVWPGRDESVYRALVTGVRDYIDKNRFVGAVIGLSGGIDSALTLAVAVDALGADRVEAVMMPSRYTAQMSIDDARAEALTLGVEYRELSIEPAFQAFLQILEEPFSGLPTDTTEENIQARCRGVILMAISNKQGRLVLTTGNKSEMAVGYATLYGDMAGGFAVIKDVPKTLVYRLANWRNREAEVIPQRVIDRPPSAELAPDQRDQDSLPPYEVLDPILELYVEQDQSPRAIVERGFDAAAVQRVISLVDRNEYKRRQAPPGVRVTSRAFGRDRRYPLTSGYNRGDDWDRG